MLVYLSGWSVCDSLNVHLTCLILFEIKRLHPIYFYFLLLLCSTFFCEMQNIHQNATNVLALLSIVNDKLER